jgi:hypothetical protein
VARMCRQLAVSRTGYLQWRTRAPNPRAQAQATLPAAGAETPPLALKATSRSRVATVAPRVKSG